MDPFCLTLLLSLGAGVAGTGIGGALGAIFADRGEKITARVLAFAGGVMFGMAAFEMLPEAISCFGFEDRLRALAAIGSLAGGALVIGLMSKLVDAVGKRRLGAGISGAISVLSEGADRRRMLRAGVIMLVAIALHNFPEGMAIGGAGAHEVSLGISVAILIAVHNVPEGMAIGAPLAGGGMKAPKVVLLACLAGSATALGALVGAAIGGAGGNAAGVCLGASAGAMLFVAVSDVFSESTAMLGKFPSLSVFAGVICAASFVYLA